MGDMRALVYDAFSATPTVRTVDDPSCPPAGAVITVRATGLCRSDWHAWVGHDPGVSPPHVPGHEFAGTITALGSLVSGWTVGDRVTVPFGCACGHCPTCRRGEQQVCDNQFQPGFTHPGSFAQFVAIDHAAVNLVGIPDDVDDDAAASLGCRFVTAYRAVVHHGRPAPGDWVAVHGSGGVGLSAVMVAAAHGARVVAVDVSSDALDLARAVGAEATVDARGRDVAALVREITGGGAAVSIDALGSLDTCQNSIRSLRKRGRHVQVGLLLGADDLPPVPMGAVISGELELYGSHGMAAHAYPQVLAEIAAGALAPQRLVRRHIGLEDAGRALATMSLDPLPGVTMIYP